MSGGPIYIRKSGDTPGVGNPVMVSDTDPIPAKIVSGGGAVDTELPAAAALADNTVNPTAPAIGAFPHVWDGANWQRQAGTTGGKLDVASMVAETLTDGATLTPARQYDISNGGRAPVSVPYLFNGTNFDRARNNTELTLLSSAARTADTNSSDTVNYNWRGGHFVINITVLTTSVIPTIQAKDPISGTYYSLLVGASIAATGITILKVYPGIVAVANASASDVLPRTFRISMDHLDATTMTYSVAFVGVV